MLPKAHHPSATTALAIACLSFTAWPVAASSQVILLETEFFADCHDIANTTIMTADYFLWGLDCPDEWAEYELEVEDHAYYEVQIRARADLDQSCTLRAIFTGTASGLTQTCELTYVGTGMT